MLMNELKAREIRTKMIVINDKCRKLIEDNQKQRIAILRKRYYELLDIYINLSISILKNRKHKS